MKADRLTDYAEPIYRYATHRTFTVDEAEDLSQEILETVLRQLPRLKDENAFEPWLWGVARNVSLAFRRRMGRQRAMLVYDLPESLPVPEDEEAEDEAARAQVRRQLAFLSAACRELLVMYYYDGLSVAQIAKETGLPLGTVTWRLSEGRRKIKKEYDDMEETALHPKKLGINIYGSGNFGGDKPFPSVYIDDALSQNLLVLCYEEARTVEELARATGVPAYYVEERVDNLLRHRAVIEKGRGRYQTDFLIWTDKYGEYCERHALEAIVPVLPGLMEAMVAFWRDALTIPFHWGNRVDADLFYALNCLVFHDVLPPRQGVNYPPIPPQVNGECWRYIGSMETGAHPHLMMTAHVCANNYQKGRYCHSSFEPWQQHGSRTMMYDYEINACQEALETGDVTDTNLAARMLEQGLLLRQEGRLAPEMPALTRTERDAVYDLARRHFGPIQQEWEACVGRFREGYRLLFPEHVRDDAERMCANLHFFYLKAIFSHGQRAGVFPPETPGTPWDLLTQN